MSSSCRGSPGAGTPSRGSMTAFAFLTVAGVGVGSAIAGLL
jgi:hypothetical protein